MSSYCLVFKGGNSTRDSATSEENRYSAGLESVSRLLLAKKREFVILPLLEIKF